MHKELKSSLPSQNFLAYSTTDNDFKIRFENEEKPIEISNILNVNSGLRKEESIGNRRLCGFDGIGNESRKDMNQKINRGSMASVFNF